MNSESLTKNISIKHIKKYITPLDGFTILNKKNQTFPFLSTSKYLFDTTILRLFVKTFIYIHLHPFLVRLVLP